MPHHEKHYRFAVLADIHIDLENGGKNTYFVHAESNLARALTAIKDLGCDFIICAGDTVTNAAGAAAEWQRYRRIIEQSGYTGLILEAMGNHETRSAKYGICNLEECRRQFIEYTRLSQKPVLRPDGKTYYAYLNDRFGDAFLFLSPENGVDTNRIDNFSDEQMDWAERMTERFRREKRRVFLIQHAPLDGSGIGDDKDDPAYEGCIRLSDSVGKPFPNNRRFAELIRRDRELIWLSGHTHLDFRDGRNCGTDGGKTCHMLHIPALAGTTRLSRDGEKRILDRTFRQDAVQGYIADVFADRAVFRGIDFLRGRYYPEYTYTIYRQK